MIDNENHYQLEVRPYEFKSKQKKLIDIENHYQLKM